MTIDGAVESFAPFHNVNCPKGFLYFNRQGELRISVLPACLSYDAPWPVRKIPLRCTAHYVAYHVESKVYAVATSVINPCTRIPRMTGEEKEFESIERGGDPPLDPPLWDPPPFGIPPWTPPLGPPPRTPLWTPPRPPLWNPP
ncbi:cleavage and polyadenylation specificity factor subunit 1-like, partial [Pezoporus occidentalis]|uniref:cleavage and polyadenylation specificity factor subunit 1-like n=1 Tax=Pezoporus occidentalis TaxID=407982 RepID=UPI002F906F01